MPSGQQYPSFDTRRRSQGENVNIMEGLQHPPLSFYVNGHLVKDGAIDPTCTLLEYLRKKLHLCGAKLGCGEGGCGACTVMVSRYDRENKRIEHFSVNACLAPVCSMHGLAVTTIEGIGSTKEKLHPVQERIYKSHGSQCGFCTPGIVMSMYTLLRNNQQPTFDDMEICFQGNLCRCTGYRPILESYKSFTTGCCRASANSVCKNSSKCKVNQQCCLRNGFSCQKEDSHLFKASEFLPYDASQEPIFPPELIMSSEYDNDNLQFKGKQVMWFRPTTLKSLLELKANYPESKLTVGNTEIGIEMRFKGCYYPVLISPSAVAQLNIVEWQENGITIGSSVTLSKLKDVLDETVGKIKKFKSRVLIAILEMLKLFAGKQIRNVACLGGNIATASPISDLNPLLMAAGAQLHLISKDGERTVKMDENFFLGYRKTLLKENEILESVFIPYSRQNEHFYGFKQAQRREDDIAIVNAGMRVLFEENSDIVRQISLAFGGMAPTTIFAMKTMQYCLKKHWNEELVEGAQPLLAEDLPLEPSAPGGLIQFRRTLVNSFFFRFYHKVLNDLQGNEESRISDTSAANELKRSPLHSCQVFEEISPTQRTDDTLGRPIPHMSGVLQATGEAIYLDDIKSIDGELTMVPLTSTHCCARILSIDAESALAMDGVRGFFSARDILPERNRFGPIEHDEEVFASTNVTCHGQIIGAIVAHDELTARAAVARVKVNYEGYENPILTIEDAIANNSFFHKFTQRLVKGEAEKALTESDHILEGEFRVGGQEHFCMEPQGTLAIPKENDEMEIICSTQHPSEVQMTVAEILGVPSNRIVCKVKRIGGGFGGKESRSALIATATAFCAKRLNKPVRCILRRDEDLVITGTRHPFLHRYKVGFSKEGVINAVSIKMYANAGNTVDLSPAVGSRALTHLDNVYRIPHVHATCYLCKTNIPSSTAFRGFGAPQSMLMTENFIGDIARTLRKDPSEIRELNMYKEGDVTHFNQTLESCTIGRCWSECVRSSNFRQRQVAVSQFNRENRWKKRGIEQVPVKFGIAFNISVLNQAGALVHIYKDGAVLVSHSGVEMGQGLHTKMIQIASRVLRVPSEKIYVSETSTDKVPNTSASAASISSDLNGMAVLQACQTLVDRLEPYRSSNPSATWEEWVQLAYLNRTSLSATGYYKPPEITYNMESNSGRAFYYFAFGVACSEVEIDCLTGDHQVLRTDIVMDVGDSLNPAIDIGQIEGAFVQGYGLFTLEEAKYSPQGYLYTRGPGTYKLPSFGDIPAEFNVSLLKNASNPRAVYSSKAVGEPPLFLASSVFFAIKNAVAAARADNGLEGLFRFDSPATAANIRVTLGDKFSQMFVPDKNSKHIPWSITV